MPVNFNKLVVDTNGVADANAVKVGPTGAGTAQTARDLGASVLLSSGTGTGQLDFTSGVAKSNLVQVGGAAQSATDLKDFADTGYDPSTHLASADVIKVAGTAQTGRDLGTSVLLSNGTGTGQVKLAAGYVAPNWGDVGNPTAGNNLSSTTISTGQVIASVSGNVTGSVNSVTGNVGGDVVGKVLGSGASVFVSNGVQVAGNLVSRQTTDCLSHSVAIKVARAAALWPHARK